MAKTNRNTRRQEAERAPTPEQLSHAEPARSDTWRRAYDHESLADTCNRKLAQAEALAALLIGSAGEEFREMNPVIQDYVAWLLCDTITEAREAYEAASAERAGVRS